MAAGVRPTLLLLQSLANVAFNVLQHSTPSSSTVWNGLHKKFTQRLGQGTENEMDDIVIERSNHVTVTLCISLVVVHQLFQPRRHVVGQTLIAFLVSW